MTKAKAILLCIAVSLALAGCKAEQKDDRAVVLLERLSALFVESGASCDLLRRKLERFYQDHEAELERLRESDRSLTLVERRAYESRYGDRAMRAMETLLAQPSAKCIEQREVSRVLNKIGDS